MLEFAAPAFRLRLDNDGGRASGEGRQGKCEIGDSVPPGPANIDLGLERGSYDLHSDDGLRFRSFAPRNLNPQTDVVPRQEGVWSQNLKIELALLGAALHVV